MTLPYLMPCPHRDGDWCLECVRELGEKYIVALKQIEKLEQEIHLLDGTDDYGN